MSFSDEFPSFPATFLDVRGSVGLILRSSFIPYHFWRLSLAGAKARSCCFVRAFDVCRCWNQISRAYIVVIVAQNQGFPGYPAGRGADPARGAPGGG
ncbi:hypothetical protein F511_14654 [Dorcoceras hygrometricum]|uniref:Uncharacterized protein n=1 Tax=Dorcoceras hygrometricum TaxID=472368 RepID=A0A2Z7B0N7_9LAMI|nr:hypothetical protein F511_14654 [Dorcoceras hygrometricum]